LPIQRPRLASGRVLRLPEFGCLLLLAVDWLGRSDVLHPHHTRTADKQSNSPPPPSYHPRTAIPTIIQHHLRAPISRHPRPVSVPTQQPPHAHRRAHHARRLRPWLLALTDRPASIPQDILDITLNDGHPRPRQLPRRRMPERRKIPLHTTLCLQIHSTRAPP
jgi:hypothetical protein